KASLTSCSARSTGLISVSDIYCLLMLPLRATVVALMRSGSQPSLPPLPQRPIGFYPHSNSILFAGQLEGLDDVQSQCLRLPGDELAQLVCRHLVEGVDATVLMLVHVAPPFWAAVLEPENLCGDIGRDHVTIGHNQWSAVSVENLHRVVFETYGTLIEA